MSLFAAALAQDPSKTDPDAYPDPIPDTEPIPKDLPEAENMFFYFVLSLLIGLFGGSLLLHTFRQLSETKYAHQYPLKFILRDEGRIRLSGDGEEDLESSWGTFGGESGEGGSRGPYHGYYYNDHDEDEDGVDDGITDGAMSVERYRDDIELEEEDAEGHRIVRRSSVSAALGRVRDEEEDVFLRESDDEGTH